MDLSRRVFLGLAAAGWSGLRTPPGSPVRPELLWPIAGAPGPAHPVCAAFGPRHRGEYDWHAGVDLLGVPGSTLVRAAAAGRVARARGARLELAHGDGLATRYDHLASQLVRGGERVERGQAVGVLGPPHLHFEVREHGRARNPFGYLRRVEGGGPAVQVLWANSIFMPHTVEVHVSVTTPRSELDVDRVVVRISDFESGAPLDRREVAFEANLNCGGPEPCAGAGIFTTCLTPLPFTSTSPEWTTYVSFKRLRASAAVVVEAHAIDLRGHVGSDAIVAP